MKVSQQDINDALTMLEASFPCDKRRDIWICDGDSPHFVAYLEDNREHGFKHASSQGSTAMEATTELVKNNPNRKPRLVEDRIRDLEEEIDRLRAKEMERRK